MAHSRHLLEATVEGHGTRLVFPGDGTPCLAAELISWELSELGMRQRIGRAGEAPCSHVAPAPRARGHQPFCSRPSRSRIQASERTPSESILRVANGPASRASYSIHIQIPSQSRAVRVLVRCPPTNFRLDISRHLSPLCLYLYTC